MGVLRSLGGLESVCRADQSSCADFRVSTAADDSEFFRRPSKLTARLTMGRTLNIFILHASDMLTDCRPHGDGLMANAFIRNLAERGHHLHVAVSDSELKEPYSSNVTLHRIDTGKKTTGFLARVRFALGAHRTLKHLVRRGVVDIVHQLNPVVTGISLPCWNCS